MDSTLGKDLLGRLRDPAAAPGPRTVEAERGGLRVRAEVEGSGPYGCGVGRIHVGTPVQRTPEEAVGDTLRGQAERLAGKNIGLPERLRVHELDAGLGEGTLRSRPDEMRGRRYTEVRLKGGDQVEVERFEYRKDEGRRVPIPTPLTDEGLERLVDALGEALGKPAVQE